MSDLRRRDSRDTGDAAKTMVDGVRWADITKAERLRIVDLLRSFADQEGNIRIGVDDLAAIERDELPQQPRTSHEEASTPEETRVADSQAALHQTDAPMLSGDVAWADGKAWILQDLDGCGCCRKWIAHDEQDYCVDDLESVTDFTWVIKGGVPMLADPDQGRQIERDAVMAWLRNCKDCKECSEVAADIEKGRHLRGNDG